MSVRLGSFGGLLIGTTVLAWITSASVAGSDEVEPIRGITISTHGSGRDWGSDHMAPTLDRLVEIGANWVAVHPYAWLEPDGHVRFRPIDPARPPDWLRRPIEEAHRRGLKILVKPHLGYWGSGFSWRGEIRFDGAESWDRFFAGYAAWIRQVAAACTQADAFCVGTELEGTVYHEQRWREIIAGVREVLDVPLCYAANWADYRSVPFWDAVDAIGIQAYFPLSEATDPTEEELRRGWARVVAEIEDYATRRDRWVVFTELGYNESLEAARRPWDYDTHGRVARELQARCLRVALEVVESEPRILGSFLWKWFPEPHPVGRNFQLAVPHMLESIRAIWR